MIGHGIKVKMARFEMNNIGSGGHQSGAELFNQIMNELLPAIVKSVSEGTVAGTDKLGKVGDNLSKTAKKEFTKIKSLFKLKK